MDGSVIHVFVSVLSSDTAGWVTGRASVCKTSATYPQGSLLKQMEDNQGKTGKSTFSWIMTLKTEVVVGDVVITHIL